jgi:hypothetical protein
MQDSEPNRCNNSPSLICSELLRKCNFDLLLLFRNDLCHNFETWEAHVHEENGNCIGLSDFGFQTSKQEARLEKYS